MTIRPAMLSEISDQGLVDALLMLDGPSMTEDERLTRAWLIEEIESRFDVEAAMNAWAYGGDHRSYVDALLAALPNGAIEVRR